MLSTVLIPLTIGSVFGLLFFAITFLQSGIDKVLNYKGNADWINSHFSKTFLKGISPLMFPLLTLTEVAAGILSIVGIIFILYNGDTTLALCSLYTSGLALLMLFFGQRIAQDYPGAATIATYFAVWVLVFIFVLMSSTVLRMAHETAFGS